MSNMLGTELTLRASIVSEPSRADLACLLQQLGLFYSEWTKRM